MRKKINTAYSMLGIIKRNFKYETITSFITLYKTYSGDFTCTFMITAAHLIKSKILNC